MIKGFEGGGEQQLPKMEVQMRRDGVELQRLVQPLNLYIQEGAQFKGFEKVPLPSLMFVTNLLDSCQKYLTGVIMKDQFGSDHDARRTWRAEMEKKYGEEFTALDQMNKLRFNFISNLQFHFRSLSDTLDEANIHTPQAEELRRIRDVMPQVDQEQYNAMSNVQKMEVVGGMNNAAQSLFLLLKPGLDLV